MGLAPVRTLIGVLMVTGWLLQACGPLDFKAPTPPPSTALERTNLKLGLPVNAATLLPIYIAAERTYQAEGLNVEVVSFNGDSEAVQAMVGGSVDLNVCSVGGLVNAINAGHPVKGFYAGFNQADLAWLGQPGISSWADLRGKSVGITAPGSLSDVLTRHVLKQHGLEPEQAVQIVAVGGPANTLAALRAGRISAGILSPPFKWQAEAEGFGWLGTQDREIGEEWPKGIFCARERALDEYPNTIRALLRAHVSAIRLARADRAAAIQTLKTALKYEQPAAEKTYDEILPRFDERGLLPSRWMAPFWDMTIALGDARESWPESRLLDRRFVDSFDTWAPAPSPAAR